MKRTFVVVGLCLFLSGCDAGGLGVRAKTAVGDALAGAVVGTATAGPVGGIVGGLLCFLAGLVPGKVSEKRRDAKLTRRDSLIHVYRSQHGDLPALDYQRATGRSVKSSIK